MDITDTLVRNLKQLQKAHSLDNASKLSAYINERVTSGVIDRSYVTRILKHSSGDPANISLGKLSVIAEGLNVESWQLLNPLGFNEKGLSLATSGTVDKSTLSEAVRYAASACEEVGINSLEFMSEIATEAYFCIATDNKEKLGFTLAKLSKSFS